MAAIVRKANFTLILFLSEFTLYIVIPVRISYFQILVFNENLYFLLEIFFKGKREHIQKIGFFLNFKGNRAENGQDKLLGEAFYIMEQLLSKVHEYPFAE